MTTGRPRRGSGIVVPLHLSVVTNSQISAVLGTRSLGPEPHSLPTSWSSHATRIAAGRKASPRDPLAKSSGWRYFTFPLRVDRMPRNCLVALPARIGGPGSAAGPRGADGVGAAPPDRHCCVGHQRAGDQRGEDRCRRHMTVSVTLVTDATVRISVRDGSRCLPVLLLASDDDECHRGMGLVHQLTDGRWESRSSRSARSSMPTSLGDRPVHEATLRRSRSPRTPPALDRLRRISGGPVSPRRRRTRADPLTSCPCRRAGGGTGRSTGQRAVTHRLPLPRRGNPR